MVDNNNRGTDCVASKIGVYMLATVVTVIVYMGVSTLIVLLMTGE